MIKYKKEYVVTINDEIINNLYKNLLKNKWQFIVIEMDSKKFILTKEKSVFEISDEVEYIEDANRDIYYHTEFVFDEKIELSNKLDLFKEYISMYQDKMANTLYGDKYIFGSISIRIDDDSFITTIRGKEDLAEYTIVRRVDHETQTIYVMGKKATLNAPLLAHLFENKDVDVIVHINHYFDSNLNYDEYAFPGTVRDSMRNNKKSFNIKYHGIVYLFDKDGQKI